MKQEEQPITELDVLFNKLYINLPYTNVLNLRDALIYQKVPFGWNKKMTEEINDKIKELNLPLIAISNEAKGLFSDSISVYHKDHKF
jgi:hypothetical protein